MGKTSVRVAAYVGHESCRARLPRICRCAAAANETRTPPLNRHVMSVKTSEEARNEQVIRSLYSLAEGNSKDTSKFVSFFTDDGYFYDVAADKKYFGRDIGVTVDVYAAAFPKASRTRSGTAIVGTKW